MTRINLVPVDELCDQHLLAEHRELTRIPNVVYRRFVIAPNQLPTIPANYTVRSDLTPETGRGHVKFFYNKMAWLFQRYLDLNEECALRSFNVQNHWDDGVATMLRRREDLWNDWTSSWTETEMNKVRIRERLPANARWTDPGRRPGWV